MTPTEIRNVLTDEASQLSQAGFLGRAMALMTYAGTATDDELIRLRFLLVFGGPIPAVADAQTSDDAHSSSD